MSGLLENAAPTSGHSLCHSLTPDWTSLWNVCYRGQGHRAANESRRDMKTQCLLGTAHQNMRSVATFRLLRTLQSPGEGREITNGSKRQGCLRPYTSSYDLAKSILDLPV